MRPCDRPRPTAAGIPTIDYDRLTLGGGATYYVSFDNVAVGTAQGEGLVKCLKDAGKTSGTGRAAQRLADRQQRHAVQAGLRRRLIKDAGYTIAADQSVPDWDNTKAGTIFEQMFTKADGNFDGVAAANDGLGGAVITVLDAATASPARSRSPARTPPTRVCSACCSAPSA